MTKLELLYDIETDGLLHEVSLVHCLVLADTSTGIIEAYHDSEEFQPRHGSIADGIKRLEQADTVAGHNVIGYDNKVLAKLKLSSKFTSKNSCDTLVGSRLVYSDRKERDYGLAKVTDDPTDPKHFPKRCIGAHTLESWGYRLGEHKGNYTGGWEKFSQEMLDYCIQDVRLNLKLLPVLRDQFPQWKASNGWDAAYVEMRFAGQLEDMQERGVCLDPVAGDALLYKLVDRREILADEIQAAFPPRKEMYAVNKKTGKQTKRHCPVRNTMVDHKLVPFNPGSRQQLAHRLRQTRGWVPKELTSKGNPVMQERVLLDLAECYPEVALVAEWLIVNSRIAILSEGANSYFSLADENNVLHGRCIHIGTVTHRCSHSSPNIGNVTSVRKPFGLEMRSLFIPFPGKIQAGFDADGLELGMLAHFLGAHDGGLYATAVTSGDKALGTDPHSLHAAAICTVVPVTRDEGKTGTYAFMYGAGDMKLGKIYGGGTKLGKRVRAALIEKIPGLEELMSNLAKACERGYLLSLDKRRVDVRSPHSVLNSLLQSAGAVVMKWVAVVLEDVLNALGCPYGIDFLQTGHVHDEEQGSLTPGKEDLFRLAVTKAFEITTELLQLRVRVSGTAKFGKCWADTH
jgi:DNA polymerase I